MGLAADDDFLRQKAKELPEEVRVGTHYADDQMVRRLKVFRESNPEEGEDHPLAFFRRTCGEERVKVASVAEAGEDFLAQLKLFIEQGGKPCCLNLVTEEDERSIRRFDREKKSEQ